MNFFDLSNGSNFWDIAEGNFFDLSSGDNFWDFGEPAEPTVPSNIIQPRITGAFAIDGVLTAYDGFWTDGISTRQWRKADDNVGTNASDISGETGETYTVDENDISLGEFIGLRVTQTNEVGSVEADSPWYEIVNIEDVYFETGSQYIRITVGFNGTSTREIGISQPQSMFTLERYNDRFDDRKYYRRNRTP